MITGSIAVFIFGALIGALIASFVIRFMKDKRVVEKKTDPVYYDLYSKKKINLTKIIEYLEKNKRATNNELEKLLGVSNTSIKRYLDELEKEDLIEQKGKTGKYVYYVLK